MRAVVRRTPLIRSRSTSPNCERSGSAAGADAAPRRGASGAPGVAGGVASLRISRACAFTSSIETRPPGPLPVTSPSGTPISRANIRTEGEAGTRPPSEGSTGAAAAGGRAGAAAGGAVTGVAGVGGAGGAAGSLAGGALAAGACGAAGEDGFTPSSASIATIAWPGRIVSPTLTWTAVIAPA